SPIELRGLELANRVMVAPMCQYSADNGEATDWHFAHINSLALSGAAMFCIEASAVEAIGRITHGCLGLWNDTCEAALKPIIASARRHSRAAIAIQLAHAGRKASSRRPWEGGQVIPIAEGGWQAEGPSVVPHKEGEPPAACARWRRARAHSRCLHGCDAARDAAWARCDRAALRSRLSPAPVSLADLQQANRPVWRLACEPHALSARGVRGDPRHL